VTTPAQPEVKVARYGSYTTTWDVILPTRQMTIKIGPIPGRKPFGDHVAIIRPQCALQNLGILRDFGDQAAIGSGRIAPRFE